MSIANMLPAVVTTAVQGWQKDRTRADSCSSSFVLATSPVGAITAPPPVVLIDLLWRSARLGRATR